MVGDEGVGDVLASEVEEDVVDLLLDQDPEVVRSVDLGALWR